MMSLARKCSLLIITTTDKPSWEVNKKSNMLVFVSGGIDAASVVVHYDTLHKVK